MSSQINPKRTWVRALKYFDSNDLDRSLYAFEMIPRTPKMYFNLATIHTLLDDRESALDCLKSAVSDDSASPVEYFQLGAMLFALEDYERAHKVFSVTFLLMAGQLHIDYNDAGLKFCLYSCEVLFNCAMCLLHMGNFEEGTSVLREARDHQEYPSQVPCSMEVFSIPESQETPNQGSPSRADYWTVFQVPRGMLYRPVNSATPIYTNSSCQTKDTQASPTDSSSIGETSSSHESHETLGYRKPPFDTHKIFRASSTAWSK